MSIFRDDCIFHGQLLADFAKQFPAKPIDPPFPADSLPTTKANDSHSEPVLPFVNQNTGD